MHQKRPLRYDVNCHHDNHALTRGQTSSKVIGGSVKNTGNLPEPLPTQSHIQHHRPHLQTSHPRQPSRSRQQKLPQPHQPPKSRLPPPRYPHGLPAPMRLRPVVQNWPKHLAQQIQHPLIRVAYPQEARLASVLVLPWALFLSALPSSSGCERGASDAASKRDSELSRRKRQMRHTEAATTTI